jgi:ATP-binding cassette, subfamily B, bacterial
MAATGSTSAASSDAELTENTWVIHDAEITNANVRTIVRALPRSARLLFGLAWQASPAASIASCALHLVMAATSAFGLLAAASAVQSLVTDDPSLARLRTKLPALLLVAAVYAARGVAESAATAAGARLRPGVRRVAESRVLAAAAHVDLVAYDDDQFHDLMMRARDRSAPFIDKSLEAMIGFAGALVTILAMSGTLAVLNPLLLPLLVVSVVPQAWAAASGARHAHRVAMATLTASRRMWIISDLVTDESTAAEVRAFTAQSFLLDKCRRLATALERTDVRAGYARAGYEFVGRSLSGLGLAVAYAMLVLLVTTDAISPGAAGAAVIAIQAGRSSLAHLAGSLNGMYEQSLYVRDYAEFLADAATRTRPRSADRAPRRPDRIDVEHVTFAYPGQSAPALRDVSLTVRRGEVLALVGENGSGKTTLALVLAGLYTPQHGAVRWDGVDLADVDRDSALSQVAVVMQAPARWPLTARENVTIGRPDRDDPDGSGLAAAAAASHADELVAGLPEQWATLLSRRFKAGQDLSGGQWQRIAVARAHYRDTPVVICDEPTAALDAVAESAVYESLRRLAQDRTVVLVTHRMVSTRQADHIAVLHAGELVEHGTHDELMALGGRYAAMYALQADAYQQQPSQPS